MSYFGWGVGREVGILFTKHAFAAYHLMAL